MKAVMNTVENTVMTTILAALLAVTASLVRPVPLSAAEVPTDGVVARELLGHLLEPVLDALEADAAHDRVAIRKPAGLAAGGLLHEEVGNFLHERGYEVFVLDPQMDVPEGAVVLDFEVRTAGFDYPRERGGFLGLGRSRTLRRGALGLSGRLEVPGSGRWLWRGSPLVQHEDWIFKVQTKALSADRPAWITGAPLPQLDSDPNWWERGLVAGLLAGVVVLYLDGAQ